MRIMSIDYGKKRIGIAISDPMKILASPYKTVFAKKTLEQTIDHLIKELTELNNCEKIIIGLPLHLSGKESEMCEEVRKFGDLLKAKINLPIEYVDERLSSKGVDILLREQNLSRKARTKKLDVGSACLILQTYLDRISS